MNKSRATLLLCLGLPGAVPAHAVEPVKTLRYIFPAAETGFDPAASPPK
jgi:oligopeptide transport system substrate-binding protein